MVILGAHMSVAGGFCKAVERARAAGCDCLQLFTFPPQQWPVQRVARPAPQASPWQSKPIPLDDSRAFQQKLSELGISHPICHGSYLSNIASPDEPMRERSVAALVAEMQRTQQLGIPYVVLHPGAHLDSSEEAGMDQAIRSLNEVLDQTRSLDCRLLLETTAGQGSCLGHRFDQLAAMLDGIQARDRAGICFDTCHVFAAGYPLQTQREFLATLREFDRLIGLDQIRAFHLNDSQRERGSRVDRHAHIGRGELGLEPFRHLLNDRRFRDIPMYLETPKGTEQGEDMDVVNLRTLRGLVRQRRARRG